jgi:hypothetical protein
MQAAALVPAGPTATDLPSAQPVQVAWAATANVPTAQFVHAWASSVDEYFPAVQSSHFASAELVPAVKPLDVPHFVTVTSWHVDVDDPGLNFVPAVQGSQPEFLVVVPATKPSPLPQLLLL